MSDLQIVFLDYSNLSVTSIRSQNGIDNRWPIECWFAFAMLASIIGSILLLLLLIASIYHEKLQRGSRVLLCHVMIMQLLACAVHFPLLNINTYDAHLGNSPSRIGSLNCSLLMWVHIGTIHAENWASFILAINRFVAVVLPHRYGSFISQNALICQILVPWCLGIGLGLPIYFGFGAEYLSIPPFGLCASRPRLGSFYGAFWATCGAYLPIILTGIAYGSLFVFIASSRNRKAKRRYKNALVSASNERLHQKRRARQIGTVKMLMTAYLFYCLCFLPCPVILTEFPYLVRSVVLWLWISRSFILFGYAATPVIFLILSSDFRRAAARVLLSIGAPLCSGRKETSYRDDDSSLREHSYTLRPPRQRPAEQ